jgi:HEAT repeat protein
MNRFHAILLLLAVSIAPALADSMSDARDVLDRYTRADRPADPSKTNPPNRATAGLAFRGFLATRMTRDSILAKWKATPAEAVAVAGPFLFDKASPVQRYEIVASLGQNILTRECADLLHRVLEDESAHYDQQTRSAAVDGLDRMARTAAPGAITRVQRGPSSAPQVPGLTPYLVAAAGDKSELIRVLAINALADCGDPDALAELRRRLQDKSEAVRFRAACLLTEFQDASGLPLLRDKLGQILKKDPKMADFSDYSDAALLFVSFERWTGKSMGKTPMNPSISSSTTQAAAWAQEYQTMLKAWDAWWKAADSPVR